MLLKPLLRSALALLPCSPVTLFPSLRVTLFSCHPVTLLPLFLVAFSPFLSAQVGKVGINTTTPAAVLHVADSSVLFTGPATLPATPGPPPVSGSGTRMMWYPDKAAFRAGRIFGTDWNKDSIGYYSVVVGGTNGRAKGEESFVGGGTGNIASGSRSFVGGGLDNVAAGLRSFVGGGSRNDAMGTYSFVGGGEDNSASGSWAFVGGGKNNSASGSHAFVGGGDFNFASGSHAFVGGGNNNSASGTYAFIGGGTLNQASGDFAFVGGGVDLSAPSFGEAVFGTYSTDYSPASSGGSNPNDRLFVIGNGVSFSQKSNAVTIMKNGRVGIGVDNPARRLHVVDGTATGSSSNSNSSLVLDRGGTDHYLSILSDNDRQTGILFALAGLSTADGGVIYNPSVALRGLQFRTGGNNTRMTITSGGNVGIEIDDPQVRLHITGGTDVDLTNTSGFLVLGPVTGSNMAVDNNEIQVRNNGGTGNLYLQNEGGRVGIGLNSAAYTLEVDGDAGKPGGGSWTASSDARLKERVQPYTDGLDQVLKIRPVTYHYNRRSGYDTEKEHVGVIAQELEMVAPYMVGQSEKVLEDGSTGYLDVDNSAMTYMLINAVKEQQAIIDTQQKLLETQRTVVDIQQARLTALEGELANIKSVIAGLQAPGSTTAQVAD